MKTVPLRRFVPFLVVLGCLAVLLVVRGRDRDSRPMRPNLLIPEAEFAAPSSSRMATSQAERFPASPRESSPQSDDIGNEAALVLTMDRDGRPVGSARLYRATSDGRAELGTTNDRGELSVVLGADFPVDLVAEAKGFELASLEIVERPLGQVRIELERGAALTGDVRWMDGTGAPPGTFVVAWPAGYPPTAATLRAARAGSRRAVLVARTERDGSFRIDGISRETTYTLTAAGSGSMARERLEHVRADGAHASVTLEPIFAALVRLTEDGGRPLRTSPRLYGRGPFWECQAAHGRALLGDRLECALMGPEALASASFRDRDRQLLLFRASHPADDVLGPITYEVEVPGYAPVWTEIWAERPERSLATHTLELRPTASDWGSLEVRVDATTMPLQDVGLDSPFGTLELRAESGVRHTLAVRDPVFGPERIDGIPVGTYAVRLACEVSSYLYPPPDTGPLLVQVSPAPLVTPLETRVDGVGSALVQLREPDGSEYRGSATLRLSLLQPSAPPLVSFVNFTRAPYALPALHPGDYECLLYATPGLEAAAAEPARFEVAASRLAEARIPIAR